MENPSMNHPYLCAVRLRLFFFCFLGWAIESHADQFKLFEESGKFGLKDERGVVLLPPAFEALGWSDGRFSVIGQITGYKLNGGWGLINLKKEFITKAEFESLVFSGANRVVATKLVQGISRKAGSMTLTGEITIPFIYDAIALHGLRAVVMNKVGVDYRFGLTDLENKVILPLDFNTIYPLSALRFAVENTQKKIALFSDNGKALTDFFIDSISVFHRNFAIIQSQGKRGVVDATGSVVVNPSYRDIKLNDDGSIHALQVDHWKLIDTNSQEVKVLEADGLSLFTADHYRISRSGKQGLMDKNFGIVWPTAYDHIGPMKGGLITVKKNGKWGLLDLGQKEALPFAFDSLVFDGEFAFGLTNSLEKNGWTFINVADNVRSTKRYDAIKKLNGQYWKVEKGGYFGLLTHAGKETVHCVYDSIVERKDSLVAVVFKKQFGIISVAEDWVLPPQGLEVQLVNKEVYLEHQPKNTFLKSFRGDIVYFTENRLIVNENYLEEILPNGAIKKVGFNGLEIRNPEMTEPQGDELDEGLQLFDGGGKFGFRDGRGRMIIPNRYDSAKAFSDGLAPFKLLGRWGYLNSKDKIVINPSFDFAGNFRSGYAIVSNRGRFGVIDKSGVVRLSLNYDSIIRSGSHLLIHVSGKTGLATLGGKIMVEPRYDILSVLPNGQILVCLDRKFGIISSDALNVVPMIYSSLQYDVTKNVYLAHLKSGWIRLELESDHIGENKK
jgi:WG containing repeat